MKKITIGIKIFTLIAVIHITSSNNCVAQKKLNKEEILNYWSNFVLQKNADKDTLIKQLVCGLKPKTLKILDSLKNEKIDIFGVYIISSPGGLSKDSCMFGTYSTVYFLWFKNNNCQVKKIINNCNYGTKKLHSNDFFEYYNKNIQEIKNEFFMPVILNAEFDINNKFKYSTVTNSSDNVYSIYFQNGNDFTYYSFEESYITNSKSLFYKYNLKLKSYTLFKLIDKQVNKLY